MKVKRIISAVLFLTVLSIMGACSMRTESLPDEKKQIVSFAEKIALAPINQPVVITGETPFGIDRGFCVDEPYDSALGIVCRQAKVMDTHQFFVVCNQKKDFQSKDNWVVMPSL